MNWLIHRLESNQLTCFYKSTFGVECSGCGAQRSLILLLKGDLSGSFLMYPPLLLFALLLVFFLLHLLFKFRKGGTYIAAGFITTVFFALVIFLWRLFIEI